MKPLKILYGVEAMGRGGTELQLKGLIDRLDRRRFQPHICTFRTNEPGFLPDACPHLAIPAGSLASPRGIANLLRIRRWLIDRRIDIVQTFFQDPTLLVGTAARLAGVPVRIASFRDLGFWRTRRQELALRAVYGRMTAFLANSPAVKDHFCSADSLDPGLVTVIPNGLDPDNLEYIPPRAAPTRVGILGNLNRPVKRIDLFVDAAGQLSELHPHVEWEIVGDGELRPALEKRVADLRLGNRIRFLGRISDVGAVLPSWDIGILCSDSEGFSNALLEYMLCGCATVATAVGGNLDAVDDGITGLLVPVDNAAALAAATGRLLADGALCRQLAEAAHDKVLQHYSWQATVAAHARFYEELAKRYGVRNT